MINNLDIIKGLLCSDPNEDHFYHLQIIKRKKEHKELGSNSMIIKTYYINSPEHLDKAFPEIVCLCDFHNARGCINLNRRSYEKLSYQLMQKLAGQIMNKDFRSAKDAYNSVCGAYSDEPNKNWIIDIDSKSSAIVSMIANDIKNIEPNRRQDKVKAVIETKNGYHLITSPFRMDVFRSLHPEIEVHKDNPTILYIP